MVKPEKGIEMEQRYYTPDAVWEELEGKRIILAGYEGRQKQDFMQNLTCVSGQKGLALAVSGQLDDVCPENFVFLFADMEDGGAPEMFLKLLKQLEGLVRTRPAAVVLVTDIRVYGKCFGTQHPLKEDELGYVCHTSKEEIPVQCMRQAEHLACRLAKEEGVNLKVVRAGRGQTGDALWRMIEAAVKVLLRGKPGEIYNLPAQEEEKCSGLPKGGTSPLSPGPIMTDSGKVEGLV